MPQEYQVTPTGDTVPTGIPDTGTGYINMSKPAPTQFSQEQEASAFGVQEEIAQLSEKLGINPNDFLGATQNPEQPVPQPPQAPPPPQPEDDMIKRFNSAEGQRMRDEFKKVMGIDPLEAFQAVQNTQTQLQQIEAWRQQVAVERQMDALKQEWGQDFDTTFVEVRQRFQQLPPQMQAALDNLDGARLLAAQIRAEQLSGQHGTPMQRSSAPSRTTNIRTTGAPVGYVKTSDYLNDRVSEAEYIKAVQAGRVIRDI
jgi:hypothetical protein